eukprot:COSAG06_NODE_6201_length_3052_cov_1.832035_2_plen_646_part_00
MQDRAPGELAVLQLLPCLCPPPPPTPAPAHVDGPIALPAATSGQQLLPGSASSSSRQLAAMAELFPEMDDAEVDRALIQTRFETALLRWEERDEEAFGIVPRSSFQAPRLEPLPEPEPDEPERHSPAPTRGPRWAGPGSGGRGADADSPPPRVPSVMDDAEVDRALERTRSEIAQLQQAGPGPGPEAGREPGPEPEPEPEQAEPEPELGLVDRTTSRDSSAGRADAEVAQPSPDDTAPRRLVARGGHYELMYHSPLQAARQRLQWAKLASTRLAAEAPGGLDDLDMDVLGRVAELVDPPALFEAMDWGFVRSGACRPGNLLAEGAGHSITGPYKLVSPETDLAFAAKLIKRSSVGFGDARYSFERELRMLGQLRHPGVCRMVHVASDIQHHMQVFELCDAELFCEVAQQGALSEDIARVYFCQIVAAVGYCHSKGVYHRDLKLECVLVRDVATRRIQIAGFGMTNHRSCESPCERRQFGTVAYMAPEVVETGLRGTYDAAPPDVWAMGVVLYVMVVCDYPFGHDGPGGLPVRRVVRNIASGNLSFPSRRTAPAPAPGPRLELSVEIKDLIGRMLTVDPARRITVSQIRQHPWAAPGMADAAEVFDDVPLEFELPVEENVTDAFDEWDEEEFDVDEDGWPIDDGFQ